MIDRICSLLKIKLNPIQDGLRYVSGQTVPANGTAGYQTGCIFQHTDGSAGTSLYVNEGTTSSCAFVAVAASQLATPGTVEAGKAVVVDSSKDVGGVRNLSVDGTLAVTGVATLTATPTLTQTAVASNKTLTMTNAPDAADAGKAVPIYLKVTVGATTYVIPAWPLA